MDNIQASKTRSTFISGFTRWGVRFKSPTPPIISMEKDSSNSKVDLPLQPIFALLLRNMEDIYGTFKGPCQYLGMISTIELDDFIWEFDTWCDMQ